MDRSVFLAGATGAIGQSLIPLLLQDGWTVTGMTRSPEKAAALERAGVHPVVCDVFDRDTLLEVVAQARPEAVLHLLTDLPPGLDPARMEAAVAPNARIRDEGTRNLVAAALAAGARRFVAESIAFAYAPGHRPFSEQHPLNTSAPGPAGITARGVSSLEQQVLSGPFLGIALRFGALYGPGTGFDEPWGSAPVHVADAAHAARLALSATASGIYNIAAADGAVSVSRAAQDLGWKSTHVPA